MVSFDTKQRNSYIIIMTNKVTKTFSFYPETIEELRRHSKMNRVNMSEYIRLSLEESFEKDNKNVRTTFGFGYAKTEN